MYKSSFIFKVLIDLWKAWDRSTYVYRHPYLVLTTMREYHDIKRQKVYDAVWRLVKNGYLAKGGEGLYAVTKKAKRLLEKDELERVAELKQQQKWDEKWRFVIFDIPEKYRRKRDKLRQMLIRFGFKKIQKSVWFTSYDILREVSDLTNYYGLQKYIILLECLNINISDILEKRFFTHVKNN